MQIQLLIALAVLAVVAAVDGALLNRMARAVDESRRTRSDR